jgi:Cation/multidrug efflux pump
VTPVGTITTADDRVFVRPNGAFKDVQALADTLLTVNKRTFRLGDIAKITRGYDDPPVTEMRVGGQAVLGIGVTMQKGGDVISLGKALDAKPPNCRPPCRRDSSWLPSRACLTRSSIQWTSSSDRSAKR